VKVKNVRELNRRFGHTYMDVIDAAYQKLYNFQPMTRRQKDYYIGMYLPLLNFDFVTIVANEKDECIGVGLGMPEISSAVRRCNGRLFPFGWFYMLRALRAKKLEAFNFLLLAIRPDYQNNGIDTLFMQDLVPRFSQYGLTTLETTSMLETNNKILDFFSVLEHKQHKRRRAYIKPL
jgi:GNAT superfamily N-acetyltransferase